MMAAEGRKVDEVQFRKVKQILEARNASRNPEVE
jgi:hypothetical protein